METPLNQPERITAAELEKVLEQARQESWTAVSFISPRAAGWDEVVRELPPGPVYIIKALPKEAVRIISGLTKLSSLDLVDVGIGDEGARALAALSALTSLTLGGNKIGAEGARALAPLSALTSLDLRNNQIGDKGARALASLSALTSLDLRNNQIGDEGARALASLSALTSLHLRANQIGDEGARALASLPALTSLDLSNNQIGDEGARALASLSALTSLILYNNQIGDEGARALASLSALTSLILSSNQIGDEGARALSSLSALTSLILDNNQIGDEGARALASLSALTSLILSSNQIGDKGARALASLSALTSLHLNNNQIGDEGARALLETWIHRPTAENLSYLNLRGNGDLSSLLPAEALNTSDAQSILAAYRRYRSAAEQRTLRPLNEAKLLVVGEEDVGKTSLIRYLVENAPRSPSEPKTPGTAIHEQINTQAWLASEGGVTLNIWDFGGQEIMRGTHRFFLTARSLYLLVLEDRRQDDRSVYEWLKTIRNRGHESPVIVVINKSDEGKQDLRLDENSLQKDYPSIVAFVRTSCDPGEFPAASIQKLRELIADTLAKDERLKHVRKLIPQAWLRVKSAVAKMAREQRVLERRDFERLCEQPGSEGGSGNSAVSDSDEQRALLRILHDLGVVVAHGLERDAPSARREITLLDPNWLTGAIYTLLNSLTVRDQGGEFARGQLGDLLDAGLYPKPWHEFILGMMQDPEVGLCFELPGSDHECYLVPEALPASEPDFLGIWPPKSLRFLYTYSFLPRGLIPRFIVQAHRNLTKTPTRWRTGVLLGAAGCNVLVRGDRDRRRIDIHVAGPAERQRAALNVVLNDLEYVHGLNPEIGAKARVPLPDQPKVSVSYQHLLNLEERHGPDHRFDPEEADRAYAVRELLEGVRRDGQPVDFADKRRRAGDPSGDGARIEGRQPVPGGESSKAIERPPLDLRTFKTVVRYLLVSIVVIVAVIAGVYSMVPDAASAIFGIGIPLVVIMLTFAAAFAGVFGEKTTERIIGLVLKWRSADSEAGGGTRGQTGRGKPGQPQLGPMGGSCR